MACDDPPKASGTSGGASASSSAAPVPTVAALPKPKTMPDDRGDYGRDIGGWINLAEATGAEKLTKAVKELPIRGKAVTIQAEKKAIFFVAAVVALGVGGAVGDHQDRGARGLAEGDDRHAG